jgi:hypothetical protein
MIVKYGRTVNPMKRPTLLRLSLKLGLVRDELRRNVSSASK